MVSDKKSIVIIGGGVAGLTTATLLGRKGFDVTLIEKDEHFGGQVKSGRTDKNNPTEHSPRVIYPKYYKCFMNTLSYIKHDNFNIADNISRVCAGVINSASTFFMSYKSRKNIIAHAVRTLKSQLYLIKYCIGFFEYCRFMFNFTALLILPKRAILKKTSQNILAGRKNFFTDLVRAKTGNPQPTDITILEAVFRLASSSNGEVYMFNGPVSEKIINYWVDYCRSLGVKTVNNTAIESVEIDESVKKVNLIKGFNSTSKEHSEFTADCYVLAVPKYAARQYGKYFIDFDDDNEITLNIIAQFYLTALPQAGHFRAGEVWYNSDYKGCVYVLQGHNGFWNNDVNMGENCKYVLSIALTSPYSQSLVYPDKRVLDLDKDELYEEFLAACRFTEKELISDWTLDKSFDILGGGDNELKSAPMKILRSDKRYAVHYSPLNVLNKNLTFAKTKTLLNNLFLAGVYTDNDFFSITKERAARSGYLAAIEVCKKYGVDCADIEAVLPTYEDELIMRKFLSFLY